MRSVGVLVVAVGFVLACGGAGAVAEPEVAAPTYASPAFQTFKYKGTTIKFNTDTRASTWWANSACGTVDGSWSRDGDDIVVTWDDKEGCMTWDEARLKQLSDCSMAQYWMRDPTNGTVKEDDSWLYERKEPKCPQ